MLDNLFQKIHDKYLSKVMLERKRINEEEWSNDKIKGYIISYFNHGFSEIRHLFGENIFGEPPLIEACIEVLGERTTGRLYKPSN